jgi:hypothetical protein
VNRNQKLVLWVGGILTVLSLIAAMWASALVVAILTVIALQRFDKRGRRPENVVVKSVRCANCGTIGEPHWPKCPNCGAAEWK